jgi:hypothetical protein
MENQQIQQNIYKLCKTCGCSSENNKFTGNHCTKCRSKRNNAKLKENDYYKIYWHKRATGLPRGPKRKVKLIDSETPVVL